MLVSPAGGTRFGTFSFAGGCHWQAFPHGHFPPQTMASDENQSLYVCIISSISMHSYFLMLIDRFSMSQLRLSENACRLHDGDRSL
jgi:hypothetical protein